LAVYQRLVKICGPHNIELQPIIKLKKEPNNFGTLTYRCDFLVLGFWYVEAKGILTPEASCKLKMLEAMYPDIAARLLIVTEKPKHLFGKSLPTTLNLASLEMILVNFQKYRGQST
jgi:hypothetical protein